MANHSFHRILGALEIDVVNLYVAFTVGASGAPTIQTSPGSKGVTSVTRNSAGDYTILLDDTYQKLLWADVQLVDATLSDPTAVGVVAKIKAHSVTAAGGGTVEVVFYEMATPAAAVDPRNGAVVLVKLELRQSTVI